MVLKKVFEDVEKSLGLPKISDIGEALKNMPDEKKLRLIRDIITGLERLKAGQEELQLALSLVYIISTTDTERIQAIKEITGNLVKLARYLPKDLLAKLPIQEIAKEVSKALKSD
jgi:hypothetical protein